MQLVGKTWVLRFGDLETIGYEVVAKVARATGSTNAGTAILERRK